MNEKEKLDYLIKKEKERDLFWLDLRETVIGGFVVGLIGTAILIALLILLPTELKEKFIEVLKRT